MKYLLLLCLICGVFFNLSAQEGTLIKAKNARKYVGKEVIVEGYLSDFTNSNYAQFAIFNIGFGKNKQLKVIFQGNNYLVYPGKVPIKKYVEKKVLIKGVVFADKDGIYLNAADTITLK